MRIYLHICCGPCAIYPVAALREKNHSIHGFFYNPNIHPYKEFCRRRDTLQSLQEKQNFELTIREDYPLESWLEKMLEAKELRCRVCYYERLKVTASLAKAAGCDAFSTTLLVSPYQKHEWIRETGEEVAQEVKLPFYYEDFRKGWKQGVEASREMELYRQPYCGCIFSEKERYCKQKKPLA